MYPNSNNKVNAGTNIEDNLSLFGSAFPVGVMTTNIQYFPLSTEDDAKNSFVHS